MRKSSDVVTRLRLKPGSVKDPRLLVRVILGALLAANLVAAVVAFKPFGGSADDQRLRQARLRTQLAGIEARLVTGRKLAEKVRMAREQGDQFLAHYVMERRSSAEAVLTELVRMSNEAGIAPGNTQWHLSGIEGSDTLEMLTISAGYEGSYAALTKFIQLVDQSPRFLIIESMQANAPAGQAVQTLSVTLKIDAFIRTPAGGSL